MRNTNNTALLIALLLVSIPLIFIVKKVTNYDTSKNFTVKFDPVTCYKCRDCPCTFILNNGQKYVLNKLDKNKCTHDPEVINKAIKEGRNQAEFIFNMEDYQKFFDCLRWYSNHPSSYRS